MSLYDMITYIIYILAEKPATALFQQWPFDGTPTTVLPRQSLDGTTVVV